MYYRYNAFLWCATSFEFSWYINVLFVPVSADRNGVNTTQRPKYPWTCEAQSFVSSTVSHSAWHIAHFDFHIGDWRWFCKSRFAFWFCDNFSAFPSLFRTRHDDAPCVERHRIYLHLVYLSFLAESDISGDSYSSTGYDVYGTHPTTDNPLGNPPYPGETYAGGPTWVTHLRCQRRP